ncbi:YqhG family protein [Paenibacillus aurantius]|uniref:YqhG family protein n=1 Tax=Paenibacillus aurantius TaxID=2918900 RepID=A0AA96RG54_9BACL|nr:YqhG family protein [Paenibacillus aurantius]WNQ09689.1 YqhG family protein [Paenibacillus aurantius]
MNTEQISRFVTDYLETMGCRILERSPAHLTVKLSPEADKDLTGRSYYWNFVERTGAPPETMTFTFVFDQEAYSPPAPPSGAAAHGRPGSAPGAPFGSQPVSGGTFLPAGSQGQHGAVSGSVTAPSAPSGQGTSPGGQESILGRYFGISGVSPTGLAGRIPTDNVTFGSRRLDQIIGAVSRKGRFVRLFEEHAAPAAPRSSGLSTGYTTWLGINYKVELACDMKRDELHSLGIHLGTGEIVEGFHDRLSARPLTPRLPSSIFVKPARMSAERAVQLLEAFLEIKLGHYDHSWADHAHRRLMEELARIDAYYTELIGHSEDEKKPEIQEQYEARRREAEWQYRPQINVSVINCGLFHLKGDGLTPADETR